MSLTLSASQWVIAVWDADNPEQMGVAAYGPCAWWWPMTLCYFERVWYGC